MISYKTNLAKLIENQRIKLVEMMNKQIKKMKKCSANDLVKRRFMLLQAWEPRAVKVIKSYSRR